MRNGKEPFEFVEPFEKKPQRSYEKTRVFQDTWACHFPWVEIVVGEDGLVAQVWCKICSNIEGKTKLLTPKFDTLQKHVRHCKATIPSSNIVVEDYFYYKDFAHAKNERTYFVHNSEFIMTLVQSRIHLVAWKKFIQFATILHILLHGRPMLEYELLRELFLLLKVKNTPLKHWLDSSDWQIAEAMHDVVLFKTSSMILKANFVVVSADEMTAIDAQQWINIHGYVMQNWKCVFVLLTFEKVEVGATSNNIKGVILDAMGRYKGLTNSDMASKWICLSMWWWFNFSRHLVWGDYSNKRSNCPISHWCALCGTLNQFGCFGFKRIILGYAHWRYVIILVCLFFYIVQRRCWNLWTLQKH